MPDREQVLTWLEICGKNNDCSGCCPYSENGLGEYGQCRESLMADAYDLLKEQEAVKPHNTYSTTPSGKFIPHIFCGKCNKEIYAIYEFCPFCGQEVKWE